MDIKRSVPHKNWPEICQLQDTGMRIVISLCQEEAVLSKLAVMFPSCFSKIKIRPKVPQSAIVWLSRQIAKDLDFNPVYQEFYSKFMWLQACNKLKLQLERYRRPTNLGNDQNEKTAYQQLHGQIPKPGMKITWNNKLYVVVQIEIRLEDINKPLPLSWQPNNLMLLLSEYIDCNS
ncbi:MAG: hypothetical protein COU29_02190 [Candidatus Magasanikbacteria bacterium CG10_big_fil_rev_8_21_14_0_10_36_32]|uniref:Uncharacterized protein n=1 Tax=Candidatus Magasanikbacteria bacterium CG10_big_fil_rev_8_21_14_0_10_36_32 TaxID=1974646 RepID=A0A2M6W740_9BACT|nr:MAG: hypothetical protein COU29_02190 [Candidatus Magasanikbacteria bacterium CG10_big_fil_rev_8_21_14_0_10_36_32]